MIMPRMISSLIERSGKQRVARIVPEELRLHGRRRPSGRRTNGTIPDAHSLWLCVLSVARSRRRFGPKMRLLLALIVILYLVGVGVVLSPTIRSTWNSEPASVLTDRVVQALPDALAWPVRAAHAFAGLLMAAPSTTRCIATARVQPAEARSIFVGKQQTVNRSTAAPRGCAISRYGNSRCGGRPCAPPRSASVMRLSVALGRMDEGRVPAPAVGSGDPDALLERCSVASAPMPQPEAT